MIIHNPLDAVLDKYAGQIISPIDIMLEHGIDGNLEYAQECLENLAKRGKAEPVGRKFRITVVPRDIDVYNHNMHEKNVARRVSR